MSQHGPSGHEPEFLSSGDPTTPAEKPGGSGRRIALIVGGAVAVAGLVGGALWAWTAFSSTGAQPAEALPADTLGYAAVDLDPSGQQKIEAIRILREFPAFRDAVDVDTDDDLRQRIVEEALADSDCDVDYEDDVEPWLGQRFGLAAVPGDEQPDPVFVVQVTDADAADEGLSALQDCGDGDSGAWEIRGEWALVAETADIATGAADGAEEEPLSDDEDFQKWTDAAGDPGIMTAYAAPSAGALLGDLIAEQGMSGSGGATFDSEDPFGSDEIVPEESVPPQVQEALDEFDGAAMTMRFADGALEVEAAAAGTEQMGYASEGGADVVSTLPEDTAVAFGLGLEEGWGESVLDSVQEQLGPDGQDAIDFYSSQLGLELPEDLETLLGDSVALALGADFDADSLIDNPDGSDVPVGAKIQGDVEAIEDVLDTLQAAVGPGGEQVIGTDSEGDFVAVGPSEDYRDQLLEDGGLGGSDAYTDVVREAEDATAVLFVNFDASDWLDNLVREQGDPEVADNLQPLKAAGLSTWTDGDDDGHLLLRVTTE